MELSVIDILLLTVVNLGLFLSLTLKIVPNRNAVANKPLILLTLVVAFIMLGKIVIPKLEVRWFLRLGFFLDTLMLLIGPFLYEYIRRLMFRETQLYRLPIRHLVPALFSFGFFLSNLLVFDISIPQFNASLSLKLFILGLELASIVLLGFYVFKSFKLISVFEKNQMLELSYGQRISSYIKTLLWAMIVFLIFWSLSYVNVYFLKIPSLLFSNDIMWLSFGVVVYTVGFYSLVQPEIFRVPLKKNEPGAESKQRLDGHQAAELNERLHTYLTEHQVFLQPDLNLSGLAAQVGTTSNNLSWVINNLHGKNFHELINKYRIEAFLKRIEQNDHKNYTLLSLAIEVGFNSKSTFNKSFKKIKGQTPSTYIKQLESKSPVVSRPEPEAQHL